MLNDEDREWIKSLEEQFAHTDPHVPGLVQGSSAEDVRAFLAPYLTADLGVLKQNLRMFLPTMMMCTVTQKFAVGMAGCPRCGDYVAPHGGSPGVLAGACGTCKRPLECRMIEYSPRVGRQIVRLAQEHAETVALLKRGEELRHAGKHKEAIDLADHAALQFRERGLGLAEAGALLEKAKFLAESGDAILARDARAQALHMLFELKNPAALTKALLRIAFHVYDEHDWPMATAILGLLTDTVAAHEPELETNADAAIARFVQAMIAARSLNTIEEAKGKYAEAHAFLTDAANQPGGQKLLGRDIEKSFADVHATINKDHSELLSLAKKMQAALDAEDHEASELYGADLLVRLLDLKDDRAMLAIANRLVMVSVQRKDLIRALEYMKAQAVLADGPSDAPIRANALRNQFELEKILRPEGAPETLAKAEAAEAVVTAGRRELEGAKRDAATALGRKDAAAAGRALARAASAAKTLGDDTERLQTLMQWMSVELGAKRWAHLLLVALEVEALTASTPAAAQALASEAQALAALGDPDAAAMRAIRAAPCWQALISAADGETPQLRDHLRESRDRALALARAVGDDHAQRSDWVGAERFYRASCAAAEACAALDAKDVGLRARQIADLNDLGVVVMRQADRRSEDGQEPCRQALSLLDALDRQDPQGAAARASMRARITAHLH